jgi:hypothetical protein
MASTPYDRVSILTTSPYNGVFVDGIEPGIAVHLYLVGTLIQIMLQKVLLPVLHSFITDYLRRVLVQDQVHKLSQRRVSYQPDISRFTET